MMRACLGLFLVFFLISCAGTGNGILVQFDGHNPLNAVQLDRYCDMEDAAACMLAGKKFKEPASRLPIVQGMAPSGKAIFSALLNQEQAVKWFLFDRAKLTLNSLPVARALNKLPSLYRIEQIQAAELEPEKTYELIAVNSLGHLVDHRYFETIPAHAAKLKFALLAGSDDRAPDQAIQWNDLAAQAPQFILSLGNNVYAGATENTPATLWDAYVETRTKLEIFYAPKLIPFSATWGDRDYGKSAMDPAREITDAFFPFLADAKTILDGPGVSRALKIAGQTFILFDNQTFRSAAAIKGEEQTRFGRIQEDWSGELIEKIEGPVWLLSGDAWFAPPKDSYAETQKDSFKKFMGDLEKSALKPLKKSEPAFLAFASGNSNWLDLSHVQPFGKYQAYEFSVGVIHGEEAVVYRNPRRQGNGASRGYMILSSAVEKGKCQVHAQIRNAGQVIAEQSVAVNPVRRKTH